MREEVEPFAAAALLSDLAALQTRQSALHDAFVRRKVEGGIADNVAATKYVEKLLHVQMSMEALAARTSHMRARCQALEQEPTS